jgi:hypothetical protein
LPVKVDGEYETRTFTCEEDVWDVVRLIIEETKEMNEAKRKDFSISGSVKSQLPFFACNNIVLDKDLQRDIQRYIYCDSFNTQPYPGSYGQQPARWVQKSFIIKSEMNKATNKAAKDGK